MNRIYAYISTGNNVNNITLNEVNLQKKANSIILFTYRQTDKSKYIFLGLLDLW